MKIKDNKGLLKINFIEIKKHETAPSNGGANFLYK
jgi:hypothetical protein